MPADGVMGGGHCIRFWPGPNQPNSHLSVQTVLATTLLSPLTEYLANLEVVVKEITHFNGKQLKITSLSK